MRCFALRRLLAIDTLRHDADAAADAADVAAATLIFAKMIAAMRCYKMRQRADAADARC